MDEGFMRSNDVKFGVDIWEEGMYERFVRHVLSVEKLGFDSIWAAEAHDLDILVKLTVAAVKTRKVKLGTVVLVPALRYPAVLAKTLTSLDIVSDGRLILGIGCSDQPSLERRGVPSDKPMSRMVESIKLLKKLWTENSVSFRGRFYQIENYSLPLKPIQKPHPPIWIAGGGPRALGIIATYADGWIGIPDPSRYEALLSEIRRLMDEKGRDSAELEPAVLAFTSVAPTHDKAEEYRRWDAPIVGNPDECIDHFEKLVRSGARHFILAFCAPDEEAYLSSLRLCAERVIPYFRGQP